MPENTRSGSNSTSSAPNMDAIDAARRAGFDDAPLLGPGDVVLEGPTYTIAWMIDGRIETPALDLGIIHSITRDVLLESAARLGRPLFESSFSLERLLEADEVLALSTTKQVTPVVRIGTTAIPVGEIGEAIVAEFAAAVASETREAGAAS